MSQKKSQQKKPLLESILEASRERQRARHELLKEILQRRRPYTVQPPRRAPSPPEAFEEPKRTTPELHPVRMVI